jgi:hypothetical protein
MGLNALTSEEREVVRRCLHAVADGPFIPDDEFHPMIGLSRDELTRIAARWPDLDEGEDDVALALYNSMDGLLTWVGWENKEEGEAEWLSEWTGSSAEEIKRIFDKWLNDQVKMQLDLHRDFAEISAYLAARVDAFDAANNNGPGNAGLVTQIEIGFESDQSAWVAVVFDTRPGADRDGKWTLYLWGNSLDRPHWLEANEALREGGLSVVLFNGSKIVIPAVGSWGRRYLQLTTALGVLLEYVLLQARQNGVFETLRIVNWI